MMTDHPSNNNNTSKATEGRRLPFVNMEPTTMADLKIPKPFGIAKLFIDRFSNFEGRREPPSPGKTHHIRLVSVKQSHYAEIARWALDLLEADARSPFYYTEDPHPAALQCIASLAVSKGKGSITPVVLCDDGSGGESECVSESFAILRRFCPFLYPIEIRQRVEEMEDRIGARLGPCVRALSFHYMLEDRYKAVNIRLLASDTTRVEHFFFKNMYSAGLQKGMRDAMGIDSEIAENSQAEIRDVFRELSERLTKNGGRYLMDDDDDDGNNTTNKSFGFTAADLTFAALAFPILRPPELGFFLAPEHEMPPELIAFGRELGATVAGKHALAMYAKHRGCYGKPSSNDATTATTSTTSTDGDKSNPASRVAIKGVRRDRFFGF